ncbi:MAG: cytidine deaminase [Pseudomonadota bacterium]
MTHAPPQLDQELQRRLLGAALKTYNHAYCPYSGFPVGAAVATRHGGLFAGCNVENAAYPLGTCAEASALSVMMSSGDPGPLVASLIIGGHPGKQDVCTPCGGCRQRLREFANDDLPCLFYSLDRDKTPVLRLQLTLGTLLPHAFDSAHLSHPSGSS